MTSFDAPNCLTVPAWCRVPFTDLIYCLTFPLHYTLFCKNIFYKNTENEICEEYFKNKPEAEILKRISFCVVEICK